MQNDKSRHDKSRYSAYHKGHGHNTDQCRNLISTLMKLIDDPQVKMFTHSNDRKKREQFEASPDSDDDSETHHRRKRPPTEVYARQDYHAGKQVQHANNRPAPEPTHNQIYFTTRSPASDALVITTPIMAIRVHRIMVETGAQASILYYDTFKKMGVDLKEVQRRDWIQDFDEKTTLQMGQITLPLKFGGDRQPTRMSLLCPLFFPNCHVLPYKSVCDIDSDELLSSSSASSRPRTTCPPSTSLSCELSTFPQPQSSVPRSHSHRLLVRVPSPELVLAVFSFVVVKNLSVARRLCPVLGFDISEF
ncbi:Unknown protein [Striga hermonthica]|uniref:Peptidase A2 domain-containing protein n=1 Tax=Striga hermonthica TaxID=68872 RepID=A0A9N7NAD5_STRHE|nr:Unknown protein [Striga hermonthica]